MIRFTKQFCPIFDLIRNPMKQSSSDLVPSLVSLLVICKYNCTEGGKGKIMMKLRATWVGWGDGGMGGISSIAIPPLLRKWGTGMHCTVEGLKLKNKHQNHLYTMDQQKMRNPLKNIYSFLPGSGSGGSVIPNYGSAERNIRIFPISSKIQRNFRKKSSIFYNF
jgi:hypothetical protein